MLKKFNGSLGGRRSVKIKDVELDLAFVTLYYNKRKLTLKAKVQHGYVAVTSTGDFRKCPWGLVPFDTLECALLNVIKVETKVVRLREKKKTNELYSSTQLGRLFDPPLEPWDVNRILEKKGLITGSPGKWEITELGNPYGEHSCNSHYGMARKHQKELDDRICNRWKRSVMELIT